jgi:diacylglycerol O-acyltransferase
MARRLSLIDAAFLTAETREMPMHVGGLQLFEPPPEAGDDYMRELYEDWVSVPEANPPFDRTLTSRVGLRSWIKDQNFDIEYHVRHSGLPRPGRYRELFVLVSRLHSTLLDRGRPLWEYNLIEGLADGKFALYAKMHHAVVDGVAAMRLLERSLSTDPERRDVPYPWASVPPKSKPRITGSDDNRLVLAAAMEQLQTQLGSVPGVARTLRRLAKSALEPPDTRMALPFQSPPTCINAKITGGRRFVAQSYPLERVRAVGKATGATINDVVLAMSSAALRRYLAEDGGGLPDKPLTAMAPVSVRPSDSAEVGNAVSAILVNLATHIEHPLKRLDTIRTSMSHGKAILRELSYNEIMLYTMLVSTPIIAPSLLGMSAKLPPFNVVISNVPGPKKPLYWNGARLTGMYPCSIVTHGLAVNITVTSYVDSLDFGITACRRSAPGIQRLIDYLEDGLAELETAAGVSTRGDS